MIKAAAKHATVVARIQCDGPKELVGGAKLVRRLAGDETDLPSGCSG